jgi:tetratricopeptide (TPR) repeat protein
MPRRPPIEKPHRNRQSAKAERKPKRKGSPTLSQQLAQLESHGLVHVALKDPELEYLFRHALIHDAAYASLVKFDRVTLHREVGEALERLYPDRVASPELAPQLAHHFLQAGDDERALKYFTLAGDAAARVYANAEARQHYTRALEIIQRATHLEGASHVASEQLIHLYTHRGRVMELSGQYADALDNYAEMDALAYRRGDRALELAALLALAIVRATGNPVYDPAQGQALAERALALARECGDRPAEAKALWILMLAHMYTGRAREALAYGEQAQAIARELGLREQLAFTLNDLWRADMFLGRIEHGRVALQEARALWRELGNLPMLADNLILSAEFYYNTEDYTQALALAGEALRVSQASGNLWGQASSLAYVTLVHLERGEFDAVIQLGEEGLRLSEQAGNIFFGIMAQSHLGLLYGTLGAGERGREYVDRALVLAEAGFPIARPYVLAISARLHLLGGNLAAAQDVVKDAFAGPKQEFFQRLTPLGGAAICLAEGELALAEGDYTRAESVMDEALACLRNSGTRRYVSDVLYLKGQALLAQGQTDAARDTFMEARVTAEALGSRRMLWLILAALAEIEDGRGHAAEAHSLRQQAREIILYIADHSPPDLRISFLGLPDVRAVLEAA